MDRFGDPSSLNPELDPDIVGTSGIFSQAEYDGDAEFQKTAAVMKMVMSGYAGAGTITMGGYDYHGQGRATGEVRDFRRAFKRWTGRLPSDLRRSAARPARDRA